MASTPSLRLESSGLDPLIFSAESGYIPQTLDLGFPVVREVVNDAPDADGTLDTSRYFGARNITLALVLDETISGVPLEAMEDRVRAFLVPSRRSELIGVFREGGSARRAIIRGSQFSAIVNGRDHRPVVAQWVCPSGLLESAELASVFAPAGSYEGSPGRTYDLEFDRVYPAGSGASNGGLAVNVGNVAVWPVVTMYGPFQDGVTLVNTATGEALVFDSSLDIVAGDWLRVDFAAKTIVNSTGTSYYDTLDFPSSTWWQLQPGENRVFMVPGGSYTTPPSGALIEWRHAWN